MALLYMCPRSLIMTQEVCLGPSLNTGLAVIGKFTTGKLKSSLLSKSFVLNRPSLSISRCMSMYDADLSVSVVFFILRSMGQMRSTKSPNLELFNERTQRNVKLKQLLFVFLEKSLCDVCLIRIKEQVGGKRICTHRYEDSLLKITAIKHSKYAVN